LILLMDTNPGFRAVAPFGSTQPAYSPTPISVGIPTQGEPIVIDFSLSSCSNSRARLAYQRQEKLPGQWLIDSAGTLTDDPAVLFADPPGGILPLGGADLGYKGFSLALMVYALSAGLAGHRADDTSNGNYSAVFLQIINPARFSGSDAFQEVMSTFVDACRQCTGPTNAKGVHIPGETAKTIDLPRCRRASP
jgi:L-lactate dehydrogenase